MYRLTLNMSLLQNLSYKEYQKALEFSLQQCEIIAKLAELKISLSDAKKPGELLIKTLDRSGITAEHYQKLVVSSYNVKTISTYYKPHSKVAILIANDKYLQLSKLGSPSIDCDSMASNLKNLGFITVKIKNTASADLKCILLKIFDVLVENSYCFIFYAGHGCQICNTKCMLGIDCPKEDIEWQHCVTENFVLREVEKCKPELCVLIMDMCRIYLDRSSNPKIFYSMLQVEEYAVHKNLIISYSAQSSQAAYEVLQIQCSTTIGEDCTYELKTGDSAMIQGGASQYVNALCTRLGDDLDVSSLLDKVHEDVENSLKKQKPIKVQCGAVKRSLYDIVTGDVEALLESLKEAIKDYANNCVVY